MMRSNQTTINVPDASQTIYSIVQQEVDLGASALQRGDGEMAVTLFQSSLQKLTISEPFHDHLVHNLLLSYRLLIEQKLKTGEVEAARSLLKFALNLEVFGEMAGDDDFCQRFAGVFQELGLTLFQHHEFEASIKCFRKSISIRPAPGFNVNLMTALSTSGRPAVLTDFTTEITCEQLGRHIFIACAPKSGSTFLKGLLTGVTKYRDAFMVYSAQQFEQDLYLPTLREIARLDTVTQQHCRASDANVQMMQGFGIRPVVLVRNIYDSIVSLLDFYNEGASLYSYFRADYPSLDEETKIDLLIDNFVPWYFQFVASWTAVEKRKALEIMWLTYEELIADKPASVQRVLEFYGLGAPLRGVQQKIKETESEKRKTRFNKGIAGRGVAALNERQKEKIRGFARYYPNTDFTRIGL